MTNSPEENIISNTGTTVNTCFELVIWQSLDYLKQINYGFGTIAMNYKFWHPGKFLFLCQI